MVVKKIIDQESGQRWDIVKNEENRYSVNYYEYYDSVGWRKISEPQDEYYDKAAIEEEFGFAVD